MSREQVRPGLRLKLLVRVVLLLHDLWDGKEDKIEASQSSAFNFVKVIAGGCKEGVKVGCGAKIKIGLLFAN